MDEATPTALPDDGPREQTKTAAQAAADDGAELIELYKGNPRALARALSERFLPRAVVTRKRKAKLLAHVGITLPAAVTPTAPACAGRWIENRGTEAMTKELSLDDDIHSPYQRRSGATLLGEGTERRKYPQDRPGIQAAGATYQTGWVGGPAYDLRS